VVCFFASNVAALGDRLDVTWPEFSTVPLTVAAATSSGWTQMDTNCGIYGIRYVYQNDLALVIMFDNNNNLAGVQVGINTQPPAPITPPWENQNNGWWTITLFFEDPNNVCSSQQRPKMTVLGDRLTLRNGNTGEYIDMALNTSSLPSIWVQSPCFVTMGTHYWYNITANMNCDYFYPVGLMYTSDNLVTFLVDIGQTQSSTRWEHPTASVLELFFNADTMPQCLLASGLTLSTMHFFIYNPVWNTCI